MNANSLIFFHLLYNLCGYVTSNDLRGSDGIFIPDYESFKYSTERSDLRRNFLRKKNQEKKMKLIDRTTNTVFVDGIAHFENDHFSQKETGEEFDREFKNLLSMKEFKYTYKRDDNWRTWREINGTNGEKTIMSYKCQNSVHSSSCGFWTLEDNPPCPFEFFSVKDNLELCGAKFSQFTQELGDCPAVIKFTEVTAKCNNPIETKWTFTRSYNKDTKKLRLRNNFTSILCGERDACELTTMYDITPKHVTFRIINATSDIIYSRVMKPDRKNFLCVESCGKINLDNMKVTANDAPMTFNLLDKKKKREDIEKHVYYKTKGKQVKKQKKTKKTPAKIKTIIMYQADKIVHHNVSLPLKHTSTPMPMLPWLKIRRKNFDFYDNVLDYEKDYIIDEIDETTTVKCVYCNGLLGENYEVENGTCCYKPLENDVYDEHTIL